MKIVSDGKTIEVGGGSGGVTMDQVNTAIDAKLDDYTPLEVYSTEETRIGTWINGKPIYRQILTGNVGTVSATSNQIVVGTVSRLDTMIRMYGAIKRSDGGQLVIPDYHDHASGFNFSPQIWKTGVYMYVMAKGSVTSLVNNADFWLAVEYTKTTDAATVSAESENIRSIPAAAVTAAPVEFESEEV